MIKQGFFGVLLFSVVTLLGSCTCLYTYSEKLFTENNSSKAPSIDVIPYSVTDELSLYRLPRVVRRVEGDSIIIRSLGSRICFVETTDTVSSVRVDNTERFFHESFSKYIKQGRELFLVLFLEKDSAGQKQMMRQQYILSKGKACAIRLVH